MLRYIAPCLSLAEALTFRHSTCGCLSTFSSICSPTFNGKHTPKNRDFISHQLQPIFPSYYHKSKIFSTMAADDLSYSNGTMDFNEKETVSYDFSDDERYLFDLNGYLLIRNVLTKEEVAQANRAIDNHESQMKSRTDKELRNATPNTSLFGSGPPRKDLGGVLEWGEVESRVFKSILAHPKLVPRFHGILGKGYRMDHLPFIISSDKGGEGFQLHGGTVDCYSGEYNSHLAYTCHHGQIRSALLGCSVVLVDHDAGKGGFCVVPGSHKSNFKMPNGMIDGDKYQEYIIQPETKAGDVILFSEGTVHGAMPWRADYQRRICLYRFAPATHAYGRSYFHNDDMGNKNRWPEKMYENLTDAERAVLEPPYANRLDRPNIEKDGSVVVTTRNSRKKAHDKDVFGTKYF